MPAEYATTPCAVNPPLACPAPRFSVVVPALDEVRGIGTALDALGRAALFAGAVVEVVVADGDPAGSTLAALPRAVAGLAQVRGLTAPRGRARQMNAGAAEARGEILVFLHADTLLPEGAFVAIEAALADGARAGAFALSIDSPRRGLALIAAVATLRSRVFGLPYGDQAVFLGRGDFVRLGGFADLPLMEDVDLALRLRRAGMTPRTLRLAVRTSPRRWQRQGALYCTLRNWALLGLWLLGVPASCLARHYRPLAGQEEDDRG